MNKRKFDPIVYAALRDRDLSNRKIAALLDVDEASVRRALRDAPERRQRTTRRVLLMLEETTE